MPAAMTWVAPSFTGPTPSGGPPPLPGIAPIGDSRTAPGPAATDGEPRPPTLPEPLPPASGATTTGPGV
jgi:hypothetical protein